MSTVNPNCFLSTIYAWFSASKLTLYIFWTDGNNSVHLNTRTNRNMLKARYELHKAQPMFSPSSLMLNSILNTDIIYIILSLTYSFLQDR